MSSLQGTERAISFNFPLCRELVMKVNVAIQERMLLVGVLQVQRGQHGST